MINAHGTNGPKRTYTFPYSTPTSLYVEDGKELEVDNDGNVDPEESSQVDVFDDALLAEGDGITIG